MDEEVNFQELASSISKYIRNSLALERESIAEEFDETLNILLSHYWSEEDDSIFKTLEPDTLEPDKQREKFMFNNRYYKYEEIDKGKTALLLAVFEVFIVPLTLVAALDNFRYSSHLEMITFENGTELRGLDYSPNYIVQFQELGEMLFPNVFNINDFINNVPSN